MRKKLLTILLKYTKNTQHRRGSTLLYIKKNIASDVVIKVELYEDEIFTECEKCGKEVYFDSRELAEILITGDFVGTSVTCADCSVKD